jgi:peroxiredoxin Q/BCP
MTSPDCRSYPESGMRLISRAILIAIVAGSISVMFRLRKAQAAPLPVGTPAPDFITQAITAGQTVPIHLSDYRGRRVVLYFYPKDNTPGCTREACAFRDGYAAFARAGIAVFGCSIDSADSHARFIKKYNLPFPLLLDPGKKIAKAYHAENGIPILGLDQRITYVIGADGTIEKVYPDVDPSANAKQIIHDLGADKPQPTPTATSSPGASVGASAPAQSEPSKPPSSSNLPPSSGPAGPHDIE